MNGAGEGFPSIRDSAAQLIDRQGFSTFPAVIGVNGRREIELIDIGCRAGKDPGDSLKALRAGEAYHPGV